MSFFPWSFPSWILIWLSCGTNIWTQLLTGLNSTNKPSIFGCYKFWKIVVQMLNNIWIFYLLNEFWCLLTSAKCYLIASPISLMFSQKYLNFGSFSCTAITVRKKIIIILKKIVFEFSTKIARTSLWFLPLGCLAAALHIHTPSPDVLIASLLISTSNTSTNKSVK